MLDNFLKMHNVQLTEEEKNRTFEMMAGTIGNMTQHETASQYVPEDLPEDEKKIYNELTEQCGEAEDMGELRVCLSDKIGLHPSSADTIAGIASKRITDNTKKAMDGADEQDGGTVSKSGRMYG